MPAFKVGAWDGTIRLFNVSTGLIYAGLQSHVEKFCQDHNYPIEYCGDCGAKGLSSSSVAQSLEFVKSLILPFKPHQHQIEAFLYAVKSERTLLLSPTASGKSLIIYILTKFYNKKTLIIVPTTNLVHQLYSDFIDYGMKEEFIHKIFSGQDKNYDVPIIITTWQSIYKLNKKWFECFNLVIGDEADQFEAKSLTSIMTKLENCPYRFGVTGTLKGTKTNQLVLEGLFGPVKTVATTNELMKKEILSNLKINIILLHYPENEKKVNRDYKTEINFLLSHYGRNSFIKNLALSCNGNTLILFQFVEKHGKIIYEKILKEAGNRPVFFVWSKIKGDERDEIRKIVENETNAIIIASSVFVRGVNIKSLQHLIFISPTKARRIVLQSIGRTLRKSENKECAILYDIVDDLSYKRKNNYALQHFKERMQIYIEENFNVKTYKVKLK